MDIPCYFVSKRNLIAINVFEMLISPESDRHLVISIQLELIYKVKLHLYFSW